MVLSTSDSLMMKLKLGRVIENFVTGNDERWLPNGKIWFELCLDCVEMTVIFGVKGAFLCVEISGFLYFLQAKHNS